MNVDLPIFIFLTLIGVKGYSMPFSKKYGRGNLIDRYVLLLPEVVVENYSSVEDRDYIAKNVIRPIFDSIWNACGFPCSLNYDGEGNWVGK